MECISNYHCYIGEGPIWNDRDALLYHVNGGTDEIIIIDPSREAAAVQNMKQQISSMAFTDDNRMIVATQDAVGIYTVNGIVPLYSGTETICYANDGKVGPDGRFYVGTQSRARLKLSDAVDGKLYSIDAAGSLRILLDGLILSNGMDWNMAENKFYHTDSALNIIKEYEFDKISGEIMETGRSVHLKGVDGFTIDQKDVIWATCWGAGAVAAIDTNSMQIIDQVDIPAKIPASCAFYGKDMEYLAIVTAKYNLSLEVDPMAGCTFSQRMKTPGRIPYRFG